jgi:beta-glucosidase
MRCNFNAGSWKLEAGSWKLTTAHRLRYSPRMLRQLSIALLAAAATLSASAQSTPPYKDASLPVERRVEDLLGRMTLEEKVAQTLAVWQQKRGLVDAAGNLDPAKAATILHNGIGQITRVSDGVERGGKRRTPRETAEFVNAIQHWVMDHTRLAIPVMYHEEALHGLAALKGTNFPVPIGLASSWDPALSNA